jgi:DNA-binding MarR family transcriptional regulator
MKNLLFTIQFEEDTKLMHFSKTELQTIAEFAKDNRSISNVAEALNKSEKHIYRIVQKLEEKDLAALSSGEIVPRKSTLGQADKDS